MALKARVLYDFNSENPGEISISENELVTLFSEEELDGWLEGENHRGEAGLFPATYVEILRSPDVSPTTTNNNNGGGGGHSTGFGYDSSSVHIGLHKASSPPLAACPLPVPVPAQQPSNPSTQRGSYQTSQGSDDDDWDDDWDDQSTATDDTVSVASRPSSYTVTTSLPGRSGAASQQQQAKSSATVGRNLNRFSTFVKSGGEAFLLGEAPAFVKDGDRICVVMGQCGPEWQENPYPFSCTIDDPTKQTKFKGMKSYMSYGLTPTHTNVQVNRRY